MSVSKNPERFPFGTRLSLASLIEFWEQQAADPRSPNASLGRVIVERLVGANTLPFRQVVSE